MEAHRAAPLRPASQPRQHRNTGIQPKGVHASVNMPGAVSAVHVGVVRAAQDAVQLVPQAACRPSHLTLLPPLCLNPRTAGLHSARLYECASRGSRLPLGVRRVIQDLMRGNSPSKTSTLQDLDRYVREPRYKGMKAPVRPCLGFSAIPSLYGVGSASQLEARRSPHGTASSGLPGLITCQVSRSGGRVGAACQVWVHGQ